MMTIILDGGVVNAVAIILEPIWWKDVRWSRSKDDVPAFHHVLQGGVVDTVGRAIGGVTRQ